MRPDGSIVVMLLRPTARLEGPKGNKRRLIPPAGAPWLLDDGGGIVEAITPTPAMHAMMPGREGLFYARRVEGRWEIIGPVTDDG